MCIVCVNNIHHPVLGGFGGLADVSLPLIVPDTIIPIKKENKNKQ